MEPQFWLDKWSKQETGFHLSAPHPLLKKFYSHFFASGNGIFVPLCGKSADLLYLAEKNHYTLGCELSLRAIKCFWQETQREYEQQSCDQRFDIFVSNNIRLLVGDYFKLQAEDTKSCSHIYDRAALIALPDKMREDYVIQLRKLFPEAKLMLVTLEYSQHMMNGPPFSVDENEVNKLFSFASVSRIYAKNIIEKETKFKLRGLNYLNECVYDICW